MKTFDQWVSDYEGKTVGYPAGSYVGECLSLSKHHIKEVLGINPPASGCNGARCYWSMFPNPLGTVLKKIKNTDDLIPKRGWIVVWNGNVGKGYGHIASILSATKTSFVSLDQNWGGRHAHRVTHNYNNVYGFLAPLNESEGGDMSDLEVCLKQHGELMKEIEDKDKIISELTADKDRYQAERDQARDDYEKIKEDLRSVEAALETCEDQISEIPSLEEYTKGYTSTGRKTIEIYGDLEIETSYKKD